MRLRNWFRIAFQFVTLTALTAFTPETLSEAANASGILVGTAVRRALLSQPAYASTLAREFNMVEPEDAMKWWTVRPTADNFDFDEADEIVRFAQVHEMRVRGHCLVWDHSNPKWLADGHFTAAQLSRLLHEHITKEMTHYAGRVFAWDVVNEALDEDGKPKDSIWYNQPGIGFSDQGIAYVAQAFRWAHDADPKALLFYNDNGGEGLNRKSDAIYTMVKDFKRRGVPVDGVGLQMHISSLGFDAKPVEANIERLTKLGLQVHITELDVSLPVDSQNVAQKEDIMRQAEIYSQVIRACMQNPGCTAIQTWGFTDKYSWIGSHSHGTRGAALPFDRAYKPKPAYGAIVDGLISGRKPSN